MGSQKKNKGGQTTTAGIDAGGLDSARKVLADLKGQAPAGRLGQVLAAVKNRVQSQMTDQAAAQAAAYKAEVKKYVDEATTLFEELVEVILQSVGTPLGAEAEANLATVLEAGGDVRAATRVRWTFGRIYVQKAIAAQQSLRDIVDVLIARGVICTPAEGKKPGVVRLTLKDDIYIPAGEYDDEARTDVKSVFEALLRLAGQTRDAASIRSDQARTAFEEDLTSKGAEPFWAGLEGVYALFVPESSFERKLNDGSGGETGITETVRLPGGRLKVSLDADGRVEVLEGRGPFSRYVAGVAAVPGVFITLGAAKDPGWRIPGAVFKRLSDDARRATMALHRLLNRAYKAHVEWEAGRKAIEAFRARATIDAAAFFTGASGVGYVYHKEFTSGGKTYEYAGVLVERGPRGLRLVDSINCEGLMPEQAREFVEEGEKFGGLVFPLNSFLRAAHGKVMEFDENSGTYRPRPKREANGNGEKSLKSKADLPPAPPEAEQEPEAEAAKG